MPRGAASPVPPTDRLLPGLGVRDVGGGGRAILGTRNVTLATPDGDGEEDLKDNKWEATHFNQVAGKGRGSDSRGAGSRSPAAGKAASLG